MADRASVVDPALFERVVEYSTSLSRGKVKLEEPLSNTTPIVIFCENFFAQFLRHALRYSLTQIGLKAKADVIRLRMRRKLTDGPVASLVAMFEEACDMWPDVMESRYGTDPGEFWWTFHERFLVALLDEIAAWTSSLGDDALQQAAARGCSLYVEALERLGPS